MASKHTELGAFPLRRKGNNGTQQRGLTLVEAMVTVILLGLVVALAVPSFRTMVLNNRMVTHTHSLVGALNLARSEAVKRSETVTVCRRNANWLNGWQILTGPDCSLDGGEKELSLHAAVEGLDQLNAAVASLSFSSKGALTVGGPILFTLCDDRGGGHARAVQVNSAGQVKTLTTQPDGAALSCP